MASNSTNTERPEKPSPDFPLFPHRNGSWCKKVLGRPFYFGRWDADPKGVKALAQWNEEKEDLLAGKTPRPGKKAGLTVKALCDQFMVAKDGQLAGKDITLRTRQDYFATCQRVVNEFGRYRQVSSLGPEDFQAYKATIQKTWNPNTVANEVQRVRVLFKFALDFGLIERPVLYGPMFKRPKKKTIRRARKEKGKRLFTPEEIKTLLDAADVQLKAMILLGLNCGFGNSDCGKLPLSAIDFDRKWINFPRPKTEIDRECPLWDETIEALRDAIAKRPTPKDAADADLVFITRYGQAWAKETCDSPVSKEFRKLLDSTGLYSPGKSFYALRHVFQTRGGDARDPDALRYIMGHADPSMSDHYREEIPEHRLRTVTDVVHKWLAPALRQAGAKQ